MTARAEYRKESVQKLVDRKTNYLLDGDKDEYPVGKGTGKEDIVRGLAAVLLIQERFEDEGHAMEVGRVHEQG